MEPPLHPDLAPLAGFLGTWVGQGKGQYPTVESFAYGEELHFGHNGKPFLSYRQRTWSLDDDGTPLHGETGYWRIKPEGRVELVLAHPTGVTEVAEGTVDGGVMDVASTHIGLTATAKEVSRLERTFRLEGDVLRYELRMAAVGQPAQVHLTAELRRT